MMKATDEQKHLTSKQSCHAFENTAFMFKKKNEELVGKLFTKIISNL